MKKVGIAQNFYDRFEPLRELGKCEGFRLSAFGLRRLAGYAVRNVLIDRVIGDSVSEDPINSEERKWVVLASAVDERESDLQLLARKVEKRIVTIEDTAELQLHHDHVVQMQTRPANAETSGAITTRDLVRNALRMRPDRVTVGNAAGRRRSTCSMR